MDRELKRMLIRIEQKLDKLLEKKKNKTPYNQYSQMIGTAIIEYFEDMEDILSLEIRCGEWRDVFNGNINFIKQNIVLNNEIVGKILSNLHIQGFEITKKRKTDGSWFKIERR